MLTLLRVPALPSLRFGSSSAIHGAPFHYRAKIGSSGYPFFGCYCVSAASAYGSGRKRSESRERKPLWPGNFSIGHVGGREWKPGTAG